MARGGARFVAQRHPGHVFFRIIGGDKGQEQAVVLLLEHQHFIDARRMRHDSLEGEWQFARGRLGADAHGGALRGFIPGVLVGKVAWQVFGYLVGIDEVGRKRVDAADGRQACLLDFVDQRGFSGAVRTRKYHHMEVERVIFFFVGHMKKRGRCRVFK